MAVTFEPALLVLLDDAGERMLATWPMARTGRASSHTRSDSLCGWTFDRSRWRELARVDALSLTRFAGVFGSGGFVDEATGEVVGPALAYLRNRVAQRLKPARQRK